MEPIETSRRATSPAGLGYISAVRLGSSLLTLAICLLLGQSTIVATAEAASEEWVEESWPCDLVPGAMLPPPSQWFQVGEPASAPTRYFTYGKPPALAQPPGNLTAIANWGDGTTSPATVQAFSDGYCYGVSAPSHMYTNTGTYPFSYTVHDIKMGLDHALGTLELHTWSEVPHLLGGPSSRTIHLTVGTPWNGLVGEFSYEGTVNPSYPYNAQIEWGDGEPPTPGRISTQNGRNTFTVSGSYKYARTFNGTINVLLWDRTSYWEGGPRAV